MRQQTWRRVAKSVESVLAANPSRAQCRTWDGSKRGTELRQLNVDAFIIVVRADPDLFQVAQLLDDREMAVVALVDINPARLFVSQLGALTCLAVAESAAGQRLRAHGADE